MLANKDIHLELEWMEKACNDMANDAERASLKANILQLKLLTNLRTNMVTIMKHLNVPMRKNDK